MNTSCLTWNFGKHSIDFSHPSSKLPVLNVSPGTKESDEYYNLFSDARAVVDPIAMTTCQTCLPTDSCQDICFFNNIPDQPQGDPRYRFTDSDKLQTPFKIGTHLRLTKNGINEKVLLTSIRLDDDNQVPYFTVQLKDDHVIEVTKEFLFPLDEEDLVHVPITIDQVEKQIENLSPESLEALLNPPENTEIMKEFMAWHARLGHLSFRTMFKHCKTGLLPKRFLSLEKTRFVCPHCKFGNAKRRSWRSKATPGSIRSDEDVDPGDAT